MTTYVLSFISQFPYAQCQNWTFQQQIPTHFCRPDSLVQSSFCAVDMFSWADDSFIFGFLSASTYYLHVTNPNCHVTILGDFSVHSHGWLVKARSRIVLCGLKLYSNNLTSCTGTISVTSQPNPTSTIIFFQTTNKCKLAIRAAKGRFVHCKTERLFSSATK